MYFAIFLITPAARLVPETQAAYRAAGRHALCDRARVRADGRRRVRHAARARMRRTYGRDPLYGLLLTFGAALVLEEHPRGLGLGRAAAPGARGDLGRGPARRPALRALPLLRRRLRLPDAGRMGRCGASAEPRLVVEMLAWLNMPVAQTVDAQEPGVIDSNVSWASKYPVPRWLDQVRELSERWIHRQQILRHSVVRSISTRTLSDQFWTGCDGRIRFVSAQFPTGGHRGHDCDHRSRRSSRPMDVVSDGQQWQFEEVADAGAVAGIAATTNQMWRLLTNNLDPAEHGAPTPIGDEEITEVLLGTRAIIGNPQ